MAHLVFVESSRAGVQALDLAHRSGHRVTRVISHKFDWLLRQEDHELLGRCVDDVVTVEDTQDEASVEAGLRKCIELGHVDAVVTTLQQCIAPVTQAASKLGLRATNPRGVVNARDKRRCRDILKARSISSVRYGVASSIEQALDVVKGIGYPVIVKPVTGLGKVLTRVVSNEAELRTHFEESARSFDSVEPGFRREISFDFIIEEVALGPMYSVEVGMSAHGECASLIILRRKRGRHNSVLEMGSIIPCGLDEGQYRQVERYVRDVLEALGLDIGMFHVEFIFTDDGPRLIEVNPRIAGGSIPDLITAATDVNLFEILVRIYAGERIGVERLACRGATSHTYIAARKDCTIRHDLPSDWFEPFKKRIIAGYADIRAGQVLRKMDGNYGTYGVVRVRTEAPEMAARETEQLRREIQAVLGVELVEVLD